MDKVAHATMPFKGRWRFPQKYLCVAAYLLGAGNLTSFRSSTYELLTILNLTLDIIVSLPYILELPVTLQHQMDEQEIVLANC